MGQDRAGVVYKDLPGVAIEAGTIELLSAWGGKQPACVDRAHSLQPHRGGHKLFLQHPGCGLPGSVSPVPGPAATAFNLILSLFL